MDDIWSTLSTGFSNAQDLVAQGGQFLSDTIGIAAALQAQSKAAQAPAANSNGGGSAPNTGPSNAIQPSSIFTPNFLKIGLIGVVLILIGFAVFKKKAA